MTELALYDTIAAIATPPGRGGVGIVRLSGPKVAEIAEKLLGKPLLPRLATFRSFRQIDGTMIDKGLALFFPGPHSFTGEDVLELHGHGGPLVMELLLKAVLAYGAKMAQPGEFSQRAFLNGKIDLTQAEAIADLINASTKEAALSAVRSLQGAFSSKIEKISEKLQHLRMMVEAAIDFPEEEIDFLNQADIAGKIQILFAEINSLLHETKQGELLKEGMSVVIVGQPNAGKSSLLNALTAKESAIVTPMPGTTRDLVKETIQIDGMPVHIIDTAGIRLEAEEIEQEGIRRAKAQLALVDRILLVMDASLSEELSDIEQNILKSYPDKVTLVMNKIDKTMIESGKRENKIYLSAKTALGVPHLREHLKECMGYQGEESATFIARRRHIVALENAHQHCGEALTQLECHRALELVAHELRESQEALGEILGKVTTEDLLGQIFSEFCIGK